MFSFKVLYGLPLLLLVAGEIRSEDRVAVAHLVSGQIAGSITFTETDSGLRVTGTITGLGPGRYGFHIHELGDISTCDATGAHFNPDDTTHGGPEHDTRHVGDLGNVEFVQQSAQDVVATVDFTDSVISLHGPNSILGRAVVLHEAEDDLGLGGNEASLTTGNAGARVACAVVGLKSPSDPWNAGIANLPSTMVLVVAAMFTYVGYM